MKEVIIAVLLVLGLACSASAEVTAEIVAKDLDDNGNIRVWTQYKVDGVEVESRYPQIGGKFVYCTRYSRQNFTGMAKNEIAEYIDNDIGSHNDTLTQKEYNKKAQKTVSQLRVEYNTQENQKFLDTDFPDIIKKRVISDNAKVVIGDEEYLVKTDGTHTSAVIAP